MLDRTRDLLWSFGISVAMVSGLFLVFLPRWETNDDVGMSMVAHGYGLAAQSAPTLIFSNVVWGYFVRSLPEIGGVLGYSIATIGVIVAFGATLLCALREMKVGTVFSIAILALLIIRPALFPQFTINAGLLTVAGLICLFVYEVHREVSLLVVSVMFSFLGFLVRDQEFALVVLVAVPLLPWKVLLGDRSAQTAVVLLGVAISISVYVDHMAYQGPAWEEFKDLNSARAPYTDFGADALLAERQDILKKYNYSQNDVSLVSAWFFEDPQISNPGTLRSMVSHLGPIQDSPLALKNGIKGFEALKDKAVRAYFIAGILAFILAPSRRLVASWVICLLIFFGLGVLGRPGILRIYIPVLILLVVFPLLTQGRPLAERTFALRFVAYLLLAALLAWNANKVFAQSVRSQRQMGEVWREYRDFPQYPIVVWGATFPYELIYPVLAPQGSERQFQLHGLGVFTFAPFSRAYMEISHGRGLVQQLRSAKGVSMLAPDAYYNSLLYQYCKEHFGSMLDVRDIKQYDSVWLRRASCLNDAKPH